MINTEDSETLYNNTEMHLQSALGIFKDEGNEGLLAITMALQSLSDRIARIEDKMGLFED